jgi:hypothetical protein
MDWATLFERAGDHEVTVAEVRAALAARRDDPAAGPDSPEAAGDGDDRSEGGGAPDADRREGGDADASDGHASRGGEDDG